MNVRMSACLNITFKDIEPVRFSTQNGYNDNVHAKRFSMFELVELSMLK